MTPDDARGGRLPVSVVLAACPFRGHVSPILSLAGGLVEAGHRVRVVTGVRYADDTAAVGATHVALASSADIGEDELPQLFPERSGLSGLAAARFDMSRIFLDPVPGQLATFDATCAQEPPDVVIAEPLFLAMLAYAARRARPPVLTLGTMPILAANPAMPPVGPPLDALGPFAPTVHLAMHRLARRAGFGAVQRHARTVLRRAGEPGPRVFFLDWSLLGSDILQLTTPGFEPADGIATPLWHVGALDRARGVGQAMATPRLVSPARLISSNASRAADNPVGRGNLRGQCSVSRGK